MADAPGKYEHWYGRAISIAGLCASLYGVGVFIYQCIVWLRYGEWESLELRLVLGSFETTWVGIARIVAWFQSWPLSLGLFVGGIVTMWIGMAATRGARTAYSAHAAEIAKRADEPVPSSGAFRLGVWIASKLRR